jgi:hypothetical protein
MTKQQPIVEVAVFLTAPTHFALGKKSDASQGRFLWD